MQEPNISSVAFNCENEDLVSDCLDLYRLIVVVDRLRREWDSLRPIPVAAVHPAPRTSRFLPLKKKLKTRINYRAGLRRRLYGQMRVHPAHVFLRICLTKFFMMFFLRYSMQCLEIPLTSQLLQYLDRKLFKWEGIGFSSSVYFPL